MISAARNACDYDAAKNLIEEYEAALGVDLCFQNFPEEIRNLSGMYGPPRGFLLLAQIKKALAGCVAVRELDREACEIKRLYVRPTYRQGGVGRRLVEMAITRARETGYMRMLLDTLPQMTEAQRLYQSFGFVETTPYYSNPIEGVRYLVLDLASSPGAEI